MSTSIVENGESPNSSYIKNRDIPHTHFSEGSCTFQFSTFKSYVLILSCQVSKFSARFPCHNLAQNRDFLKLS